MLYLSIKIRNLVRVSEIKYRVANRNAILLAINGISMNLVSMEETID